jgi:hypothetical protein
VEVAIVVDVAGGVEVARPSCAERVEAAAIKMLDSAISAVGVVFAPQAASRKASKIKTRDREYVFMNLHSSGEIHLESKLGQGSTVILRFPKA